MDHEKLLNSIENNRIVWRKHAFVRMTERSITRAEVRQVLCEGQIIKEYAEDKPFSSYLFDGTVETRHLHVVASYDPENETVYIITVYEPNK